MAHRASSDLRKGPISPASWTNQPGNQRRSTPSRSSRFDGRPRLDHALGREPRKPQGWERNCWTSLGLALMSFVTCTFAPCLDFENARQAMCAPGHRPSCAGIHRPASKETIEDDGAEAEWGIYRATLALAAVLLAQHRKP